MYEIKVWATPNGRGITNNKEHGESMGWLPMVPLADLERAEAELKKMREQKPMGYVKAEELSDSKKKTQSCNLWPLKYDCDTPVYAAPVAQQGWLPIESAPKDGTVFLGYRNGRIANASKVQRDDCEMWAFGNQSAAVDVWPDILPTHWMPLPTAPEAV